MKTKYIVLTSIISAIAIGFLFWYNPLVGGFLGAYLLFFLVFQLYTSRGTYHLKKSRLYTNLEH